MSTNQRDKKDQRPRSAKSNKRTSKQKELPIEVPEEKREERKFVPWLGEARPKRGPIYDVESKVGSKIALEFLSGRRIEGMLVSCDRSANMVLEDTVEFLDDGKTRKLGKIFTCGRVESMGEIV